jgi:hypothetical protein
MRIVLQPPYSARRLRVRIDVGSSNEYCWRVREIRIPVLYHLGMGKLPRLVVQKSLGSLAIAGVSNETGVA